MLIHQLSLLRVSAALLALLVVLPTAGCVVEPNVVHEPPVQPATVVVQRAPPQEIVETMPPAPGPAGGWIWQRGHWRWNGATYVWTPGRWVERPAYAHEWVAPHWEQHPAGGYVFIEGSWR